MCSRKCLAPGERSQVFPSEQAILHNFCGILFVCHHSNKDGSGQILILLTSMKSPWACAGVMGCKSVKLDNNSAGTSEGGVKFTVLCSWLTRLSTKG